MASSYQHRLEAVEERLGIRECPKGSLCYKCYRAKLHAVAHGQEWSGCDGRPSRFDCSSHDQIERALAELTQAELEQDIADLEILVGKGAGNALMLDLSPEIYATDKRTDSGLVG